MVFLCSEMISQENRSRLIPATVYHILFLLVIFFEHEIIYMYGTIKVLANIQNELGTSKLRTSFLKQITYIPFFVQILYIENLNF